MIAGHAALLALKSRPAGEAHLRPRRGHARDDQAASVGRPASHRRDARRPADGDGHRRVLDGGAYATLSAVVLSRGADPRERPLPLRPHPHPRPRGDDEHAAERRVPRLRRAADAVRRRSAHGPHRRARSASIRCACASSTRCARATPRRPGSGSGTDCSALQVLREAVKRTDFKRRRRALARHATAASASRCSSTAPDSPAAAR